MSIPRTFISDDRLLTANESINIDTHFATVFDRVIEEVEVNQDYNEHGTLGVRSGNKTYYMGHQTCHMVNLRVLWSHLYLYGHF